LAEKALSQELQKPILIAISSVLERRKSLYYKALEKTNRTLDISDWVLFFAEIIVEAHAETMRLLYFVIAKGRLLRSLDSKLNPRQTKALLRMFDEGPDGFTGGMSAEKYMAMTKASRSSATRDLKELVELGVLQKTGELRGTRYVLNLDRSTAPLN
jgi:Fic family protein